MHACMHAYIHTYIHTYIPTNIPTNIIQHIHTSTHVYCTRIYSIFMFLSIYCRQFSLTLNYPTLRSPVWRYRIGDSGIQYPAKLDGDVFCFGKGNAERSKLLEAWMRMRYLVFFSDFTPYLQRNGWRSQELKKIGGRLRSNLRNPAFPTAFANSRFR